MLANLPYLIFSQKCKHFQKISFLQLLIQYIEFDLKYKKNAVISDTVGFIRELPHHLIENFKSTLSEVAESNLLIHVIDLSDDNFSSYIKEVNNVLESIGAKDIPKILVFNKIDQNYNPENFTHLEKDSFCYISENRYGIESLRNDIG